MTLQDFKAAAQGDERLAMARWLYWCSTKKIQAANFPITWDSICLQRQPHQLQGGRETPIDWFDCADAVLAELARQREADKAQIEVLINRDRNEEYHICKYWDSLDEARKIYDLRRPINQ